MALADRVTSRLGRSLEDGFAADRVVRTFGRIRREGKISAQDRTVLRRAVELLWRFSQGDLGREELDRCTFGSHGEIDQRIALSLQAPADEQMANVQEALNKLLRGGIPDEGDLLRAEDFFIDLSKNVLRQSQAIEGPRRPNGLRVRLCRSALVGGDTT
jgi:hypothetical protein